MPPDERHAEDRGPAESHWTRVRCLLVPSLRGGFETMREHGRRPHKRLPAAALSEEWLSRPDKIEAFYAGLRDHFEPGKPLWITETADAACGGNPWASTFLDSFRYLDQHGPLCPTGRSGHRSQHARIERLWTCSTRIRLLRGPITGRLCCGAISWARRCSILALSPAPSLHLYAHCFAGYPGRRCASGDQYRSTASQSLDISRRSERYTLTASQNLEDTRVQLNGTELKLGSDDSIPQLTGMPTHSGQITLAPASITFLAIPKANNASCR